MTMDFDPHPYYQPKSRGPWAGIVIVVLGLVGLIAWVTINDARNSEVQLPEGPGTLEYIVTLDGGQARVSYPAIGSGSSIIISENWFKTYEGTTARGQFLRVDGMDQNGQQNFTCEIRFHGQTVVKNRGTGHVACEIPAH